MLVKNKNTPDVLYGGMTVLSNGVSASRRFGMGCACQERGAGIFRSSGDVGKWRDGEGGISIVRKGGRSSGSKEVRAVLTHHGLCSM